MRRKQVWRYYCDHCGKGGCSAYHIRFHETRCTLNPNRECGCCHTYLEQDQPDLQAAMALLPPPDGVGQGLIDFEDERASETAAAKERDFVALLKGVLPSVREALGDCPVCLLAALRQKGIRVRLAEGFDFTKELTHLRDCWNDEQASHY